MEKKFTALRIVATIWKILAWLVLVIGILSSIGILLTSILGGGAMEGIIGELEQGNQYPGMSLLFSAAGGIVGFLAALIGTLFYFVLLYAGGEIISLFLAIEENTRQTALWMQSRAAAPPAYAPPNYGPPSV